MEKSHINIKYILILVALFIFDIVVKNKFPKLWNRIQFPCNVIVSILSTVYVLILIWGVVSIYKSSSDIGSKIFFIALVLISIVIFVLVNISCWKRWLKERKEQQSTLDKPKS